MIGAHKVHMGLHANIKFDERQRRVVESIVDIRFDLGACNSSPGNRGKQDPIIEDLRWRGRNVFTELPLFRPFAVLTFHSFFVLFRESMSWPSSIITVSSP